MPVSPEFLPLLEDLAARPGPLLEDLPVDKARRLMDRALIRLAGPPKPVGSVEDLELPDRPVPLRVYEAREQDASIPPIVYFHGSGFVLGGIETHDSMCRAICRATGATVVSVGYRLAPEARFPTPLDDCEAAVRWLGEHRDGGARGVIVAGDSAGGALAAGVAMRSRERELPEIRAQVLLYPTLRPAFDTASYHEYGAGFYLTSASMRWFWEQYLGGQELVPHAAPLMEDDMGGLPAAVIVTAECDPLRDDGEEYAERLRSRGVSCVLRRYSGAIHGFCNMDAISPLGGIALQEVASDLRRLDAI